MFDIVFDHPDFLVINKYPNVSVHKDDNDVSLLSFISEKTGVDALYLIHRLDKMTSGLLLLGKNQQAASTLSSLFAQREVEKFYLAVSKQKPKKKQGAIIGDMAKSRRSMWKLSPSKNNPAVTQFFSTSLSEGYRLFLCKPRTGKTHQIRVALKSLGSPILGDDIYGGQESDRGYLHAYGLQFFYKKQKYAFFISPSKGAFWGQVPDEWLNPDKLNWPKI